MPPQRVVIVDAARQPIKGEIAGPFEEGSTAQVTCRAEGGRPPPDVHWYKDNLLIDDSYKVVNEGPKGTSSTLVVENSLHMEKISRADLKSVLTCKAISSNLSSTTSTQVTLDINCEYASEFSTVCMLTVFRRLDS